MSRRLIVQGRVQGVWFRGWTVDQAKRLGLDGWVRNRRDGTVEMLVSGPEEAVGEFVARCHTGPPSARVERVDIEEVEETPPPGFEHLPTV